MRGLPRFSLLQLLQRDANNLDLVRLVCSCLVLYGHSFSVINSSRFTLLEWDPFMRLKYPGVYAASTAVKVFFFISGLLVTNSLLTKGSVRQYIFGRVFRIWPALVVVLLVSAFVIGPAFTLLKVSDYFSLSEPYHYAFGNILMLMPEGLPGVFCYNPVPRAINLSLWTLPYEVGAYIVVLLLWLIGTFRHRWLCAVILVALVIDPLRQQSWLLPWIDPNPQVSWLPFCFALGSFLAVMASRITLTVFLPVGLLAGFVFLRHTAIGLLVGIVAMLISLLYFSALPWVRRLRLKTDLSYGTFIWGFPLQQIVVMRFPHWEVPQLFAVSLALALGVAYCSWHLIERPAIRLGRRWAMKPTTTELASRATAP